MKRGVDCNLKMFSTYIYF